MANSTGDTYVRRTVIITLLWLTAMLIGGLLLLQFGDALREAIV